VREYVGGELPPRSHGERLSEAGGWKSREFPLSCTPLLLFDTCYVQSRLTQHFGELKIQPEGPQKHYPSVTWAEHSHISTDLNEQQGRCLCLASVCGIPELRWNLALDPRGLTNPLMNCDSLIGIVCTQFPDLSALGRCFLSLKMG
jgi:hypothetical protein